MAAPMGSSPKMRFPGASPPAPAATNSGTRCSSRGWLKAAYGALCHSASSASRCEAGDSTACVSQSSKARAALAGLRAKIGAQVMEAHAAANDQHALVAQRRQGAARS